jgi:hypothetical protein
MAPQSLLDMADTIHVERIEMDFSGHSVSSVADLCCAKRCGPAALFLIGIAADSRFSIVYYIGQKYTMQEYSSYFLD